MLKFDYCFYQKIKRLYNNFFFKGNPCSICGSPSTKFKWRFSKYPGEILGAIKVAYQVQQCQWCSQNCANEWASKQPELMKWIYGKK